MQESHRNPSPPCVEALANSNFPRKSFRPRDAGNEIGSQSSCRVPGLGTLVTRGPPSTSPDSRISLLKGGGIKQGMRLLAKHRASSRNSMCAQLKVGCPRGLPVQT
uniref:Uncharacterized protein n=1 Tax=Canis lupus familiaris TaxID=9615 RepID=A0A8C0SYP3_CANLF